MNIYFFKENFVVLSFFFICEAKKKESTKERRKHAVKWLSVNARRAFCLNGCCKQVCTIAYAKLASLAPRTCCVSSNSERKNAGAACNSHLVNTPERRRKLPIQQRVFSSFCYFFFSLPRK